MRAASRPGPPILALAACVLGACTPAGQGPVPPTGEAAAAPGGIDFAALAEAEGLTGAASGPLPVPGGPADFTELERIEARAAEDRAAAAPRYMAIETRLLDSDLVNFIVEMRGATRPSDVEAYARCAAAQYAVIRGYGFARHVRTNVEERGGVWRGDAVYTISPALPRGLQTIDAEVTLAECLERGIPTV